jgi:hypothetical protein
MLTGNGGFFMKYAVLAIVVLVAVTCAFGADVDGKWAGTIPGMDIPVSYTFKAEGATLTGTSSGPDNTTVPIKDGKINGNNISFTVTFDMGGQEMKLEYKGVVSSDSIKLVFDMMGQTTEIPLKKAK